MKLIAAILMTALCAMVPLIGWLAISVPADSVYNHKFASHVTMAYDQATFEGMLTQVNTVWQEMNNTFRGFDYAATYNTWWYPDQTYDNSLQATNDYFVSLTNRLNSTIDEQHRIQNGNQTIMIPYNQWYQTTLDGFRNESKREGGLDWVIKPAWYMTFANSAYWLWPAILGIEAVLIVVTFVVWLSVEG